MEENKTNRPDNSESSGRCVCVWLTNRTMCVCVQLLPVGKIGNRNAQHLVGKMCATPPRRKDSPTATPVGRDYENECNDLRLLPTLLRTVEYSGTNFVRATAVLRTNFVRAT